MRIGRAKSHPIPFPGSKVKVFDFARPIASRRADFAEIRPASLKSALRALKSTGYWFVAGWFPLVTGWILLVTGWILLVTGWILLVTGWFHWSLVRFSWLARLLAGWISNPKPHP